MNEIEELVYKIISGELKMSRDERQIYANNSKEIEKRLDEIRKSVLNGKAAAC